MQRGLLTATVSAVAVLTLISVLASSFVPPNRTASANCSSCHGSAYYLRVAITDLSSPASIDQGGSDQATVSVEVSGSGTDSRYAFSITVRILSADSRVAVSAQQTDTGKRPSGSSSPYRWTKTYTFDLTGSIPGTDTLRAEASMDPNHESPAVKDTTTASIEVIAPDRPPVLSAGAVSPATGVPGTVFRYKVTYRDPEGDLPSYVRAVLDGIDVKEMSPTDGVADTIVDGEEYSLAITLTEIGTHTFRFETMGGGLTARLPSAGDDTGPVVVKANEPPVLSDPSLAPRTGGPGTSVTFSVTYSDPDDDPPQGGVVLRIDGSAAAVSMTVDTQAAASLHDGSFVNGERFQHSMVPSEGAHDHSFAASDGELSSTIGPFEGPIISAEPTLVGSISSPAEGSLYSIADIVLFNGSYISNVPLDDVTYIWHSNISGELSAESSFGSSMEKGDHTITLHVSSAATGLSHNTTIRISVMSAPPPPLQLIGRTPTGDITLNETEEASFSVSMRVNSGHPPDPVWTLDGSIVATGSLSYILATDHSMAGRHLVRVILSVHGVEWAVISWNVTVIDVPAGIELTDPDWDLPYRWEVGEIIAIDLPVTDEGGGALTATWTIDGIPTPWTGTYIELIAGERPFGTIGIHRIEVIVTNVDGYELPMSLDYLVNGTVSVADPPDPAGPSQEKEPLFGPISEEWLGYLILLLGALGLVKGLVGTIAAILPGREQRTKGAEQEEEWE